MPTAASLRLPAWVDDVDDRVDEAWERLRGVTPLDRLFYAASAAGDFSAIWHGYNIVRVLRGGPGARQRFVRLALALGLESILVNQVIKRAFRRERPIEERERPHHLRTPSTSSFPSGHASSATLAVSLINQDARFRRTNRVIAAVVATSRIHVRIHHASDVAAGALVGAAGAAFWKRIWPLR